MLGCLGPVARRAVTPTARTSSPSVTAGGWRVVTCPMALGGVRQCRVRPVRPGRRHNGCMPDPTFATGPQRVARERRRRRARARGLLGLAALVALLLGWGMVNPTRLLVVDDVLGHPIVWSALLAGLIVAGCVGFVDDPHRRVVVGVLSGGVVVTCFGLLGLVVSMGTSAGRASWRVPPTSGALVAVVDADGDTDHPVTRVHVQDGEWSLGAHRHLAACVQSPTPTDGRPERIGVRWASPTRLVVTSAGHEHVVDVDADGAPRTVVRVGLLCR